MVQLSKTGVRDTLKAGHPPAVKAGGKRVVKKSADENANVEKETRKTDKPRSVLAPSRMQHLSLLLSGPLEKVRTALEDPHFVLMTLAADAGFAPPIAGWRSV